MGNYYNAVSFPGLGIGEINLENKGIDIPIFGGITIRWYAIFIVLGMVIAYFVCNRLRKKFGIKEDHFLDCIIYTVPIAFIGARITYVLGDLKSYTSFKQVLEIWNGGLAIYGGVIFAAISVFVICKIHKCSIGNMLDVLAVGLLIGQIVGRWGNFVNIEVYGVQTSLPWAMGLGYFGSGAEVYVHPLFLYEILWNLVGFILIFGYKDYRKFRGEMFLWYTAWYGLGRGLMEPLRDPQFNLTLFGVRIMMILAFAMCISAIVLIIVFRRKSEGFVKNEEIVEEKESDYEKQFKAAMDDEQNKDSESEQEESEQEESEQDETMEEKDGEDN